MEKSKTCAFTGHRPELLPWGYDEKSAECSRLKEQIRSQIINAINKDYRHFISGMAIGCDTFFAEMVLESKKDYPDITLECAIPYRQQFKKWLKNDKDRYFEILKKCDKTTILSEEFKKGAYMVRNRYMVDNASLLIAVYNGVGKSGTRSTINYAKMCGIDIVIIDI